MLFNLPNLSVIVFLCRVIIIFINVEVRDLISNDIGIILGGTTIFQIKTKYLDNDVKQYYKTIEDILFDVKVPIFITLSF